MQTTQTSHHPVCSLVHYHSYDRLPKYKLAKRKHEVMNDAIFHPVHFGEAQQILDVCNSILQNCERLKEKCPASFMSAFISLIYYPACGTANLFKMWIISGRNKLYANQNRIEANILADQLPWGKAPAGSAHHRCGRHQRKCPHLILLGVQIHPLGCHNGHHP